MSITTSLVKVLVLRSRCVKFWNEGRWWRVSFEYSRH